MLNTWSKRIYASVTEGYGEPEAGAFADFAFNVDPALMELGDVFDDAESEAGAADGAAAGFVHPVKALKEAGVVLGGNAGSLILDFNDRALVLLKGFQGDGGFGMGVFDRVLDEIEHGLLKERGVQGRAKPVFGFEPQVQVSACGGVFDEGKDIFEQRSDFTAGHAFGSMGTFDTGEGEKIIDNVDHALGLHENSVVIFADGLGVAGFLGEQFCVAFDGGEGGAQFMGDVGNKVLAQRFEAAEGGDILHENDNPFGLVAVDQQRSAELNDAVLFVLALESEVGLFHVAAGEKIVDHGKQGGVPAELVEGFSLTADGVSGFEPLGGHGIDAGDVKVIVEYENAF